ncbi:MAG: hypothetical protein AB7I18_05245 [Candidatus Berkiella sp.]
MPNALLSKMQEIIDYNKDAGILTKVNQTGERVRFFSKNGPKIAKISELGEGANQFIYSAHRNYANGSLSPPYTPENVEQMFKLFNDINKDLQGDKNGTDAQKVRHQEWQAFWEKQLHDFPDLLEHLPQVQQEILAGYRLRTLCLSIFKPKINSTQRDEIKVQDFLQAVNHRMCAGLSAKEAYAELTTSIIDPVIQTRAKSHHLAPPDE